MKPAVHAHLLPALPGGLFKYERDRERERKKNHSKRNKNKNRNRKEKKKQRQLQLQLQFLSRLAKRKINNNNEQRISRVFGGGESTRGQGERRGTASCADSQPGQRGAKWEKLANTHTE